VAIVIGAGPAGLVTSLALATVCSKVHLLEKHDTFIDKGATFGIMPNGKHALQQISPPLWQELSLAGISTGPSAGIMLPWWEMRNAAVRIVQTSPTIQLTMGTTFSNIHEHDTNGKITVHLQKSRTDEIETEKTTEGEHSSHTTIQGDFVVAADGVHSQVREWLGLPAALETGSTVFRGSLTVPSLEDRQIQSNNSLDPAILKQLQSLLRNGPVPIRPKELNGVYLILFNFHSKYPGRLIWVLSTTNDIYENDAHTQQKSPIQLLREAGLEEDEIPLFQAIFRLSDPQHLQPYPSTKVIDFSDSVLESYGWGGKKCITLVGDAAHAMRPTDGQGGNQAFEDALVLCRTLQDMLTNNDEITSESIATALRTFEATRLPRVKRIHDEQRIRYEKRMSGEKVGPPSKEFQDWVAKGV